MTQKDGFSDCFWAPVILGHSCMWSVFSPKISALSVKVLPISSWCFRSVLLYGWLINHGHLSLIRPIAASSCCALCLLMSSGRFFLLSNSVEVFFILILPLNLHTHTEKDKQLHTHIYTTPPTHPLCLSSSQDLGFREQKVLLQEIRNGKLAGTLGETAPDITVELNLHLLLSQDPRWW